MMRPSDWRGGGATLRWRGLDVFYRTAGSGEPLLLLHGFPTSSWDFYAIWDALAASHKVVTLDYIGFGFSAKPAAGPYSIHAYADQAQAVLAHLGIARTHVLAHDLGDTVAQELLARAHERADRSLASVAFLNGGLFPELHRARPAQKLLNSPIGFLLAALTTRRLFERGLAEVFGPRTQPSPDELAGFWTCATEGGGPRNFHHIIRYIEERKLYRERWVRPIVERDVPMCFINGSRDPVSGAHVVAKVKELVPGAEIHELPEIGHYPQTEAPGEVLRTYTAFRTRLARRN